MQVALLSARQDKVCKHTHTHAHMGTHVHTYSLIHIHIQMPPPRHRSASLVLYRKYILRAILVLTKFIQRIIPLGL